MSAPTTKQLQTLKALSIAEEGVSLRDLGKKLGITHVSVQQSLKLLERDGLVALKPTRKLTAKGRKALQNAALELERALSDVA